MKFDIITIFPHIFDSYFQESILKRAQKRGLVKIAIHNLRDFAIDKHKKVDDRPYGGGPGMVIKIEPVYRAVQFLKSKLKDQKSKLRTRIILFSAKGNKFDSKTARRLSKYNQLILICGRYEGVDERVVKYIADEEISIGDFVLSGGELPAMVLTEAVSRYIPGVLGKEESLEEKRYGVGMPVYTRPEMFKLKTKNKKLKTLKVPKILLSGKHKKIEEWRKRQITNNK
jgi:tRNA (guanine37-N1)-methyltransferase